MARFTISGDSLEELLAAADELRGDAPKATRGRKKAEAPAPAQPEPASAPGANPFTAPQPAPVASGPFGGFAPGAADPHANAAAERPSVTKFKGLLETLSAQHGRAQVFVWAIQKAFGLSPAVTEEEFLTKLIHQQPDEALEAAYHQGGGKD